MKNELTVLENKLPLRAYPEKELDAVMNKTLKFWLAKLLSLKEDAEEKLDFAMPSIKRRFWSLGLHEVKKAFEMYADGELRTQPINNHLDRILVGKIFQEYRDLKPKPKTPVVSNEEISEAKKADIIQSGIKRARNEYHETGTIGPGYAWIYDHFDELGIIKLTVTSKRRLWAEAGVSLKKSQSIYDKLIAGEARQKVEAKRLALQEFFQDEIDKENKDNPPPY